MRGDKDIKGEILIDGSTEEGDEGVISIFIKTVKRDKDGKEEVVEYNKEVEKLMFDLWDIKIDQCINVHFSIYSLLNQIESHCYFWYKGSLTSPPCTENVDRFILKYPIYITP